MMCISSHVSVLPWRFRSLELFFATNQGPWSGEHLNNKSPRLSRKFSSPPPVSMASRAASPIQTRKLSLSSAVGCRSGALDLSAATSSAAGSPTSTYNPLISSPPPTCTKAPLDLSRGPGSPELAPEDGGELPRIDAFCGKLRRSIRRGEIQTSRVFRVVLMLSHSYVLSLFVVYDAVNHERIHAPLCLVKVIKIKAAFRLCDGPDSCSGVSVIGQVHSRDARVEWDWRSVALPISIHPTTPALQTACRYQKHLIYKKCKYFHLLPEVSCIRSVLYVCHRKTSVRKYLWHHHSFALN